MRAVLAKHSTNPPFMIGETSMHASSQIAALIKQAAREAGFDLAGIAPVGDFPELDYFPQWIAAGYAGEMKYLEARDETGALKRASLRSVAPWARSVISAPSTTTQAIHTPRRCMIRSVVGFPVMPGAKTIITKPSYGNCGSWKNDY